MPFQQLYDLTFSVRERDPSFVRLQWNHSYYWHLKNSILNQVWYSLIADPLTDILDRRPVNRLRSVKYSIRDEDLASFSE